MKWRKLCRFTCTGFDMNDDIATASRRECFHPSPFYTLTIIQTPAPFPSKPRLKPLTPRHSLLYHAGSLATNAR